MAADKRNDKKIEQLKQKAQKYAYDNTLDGLTRLGFAAIKYATERHEFENYLNNTEDSYGFAIWYNGTMVLQPTFFGEPKAMEGIKGNWNTDGISGEFGRERSKRILQGNRPSNEGWTMMVTTGTPYSYRLESLLDLDVLTGAFAFTEGNWNKYFKKQRNGD